MAVKTFEREVKKLSSEFKNLIENYDFKEYDFHSIRQTLQDYIEQSYPNYNDFFRSDYVMMLIELFAFYGEMMAYRVDMNMNEAYLSTAKDRRNIIKIADMLGYKHARIEPAISISKVDMTNQMGGARFITKKKQQGSVSDILSKSSNIVFEPITMEGRPYFPYKLDYLLRSVTAEDFMNTVNNIFQKLEDFKNSTNIKTKSVVENNFEYYERSIFVDKFQMRFNPNENVYVDYAGSRKMFEVQSLVFDQVLYFSTENTIDALNYNDNNLYSNIVELGFEFVLRYDKANNILDKNIYMYIPMIQGGTFTRDIDPGKGSKNFREIAYEKNIFNNRTLIRQYDQLGNTIRTYYEVENLNNNPNRYAYEMNNTPEGFVELVFGDGKNSEILLPAAKTLLFYRKNGGNTDEIYNVKNAEFNSIALNVDYYDANVGKVQNTILQIASLDRFNADGGISAESDEQIKYMARKIRSVQDRFVTGKDYETAGMLHPRVRYTTVVLRSYIGKNSARMSNEYLDVYFDQKKHNISVYDVVDTMNNKKTDTFVIVPSAYFTESSVVGKYDSIKFMENNSEYFFEIFDIDSLSPNDWFKYPAELISDKSKGTIIKLVNKFISPDVEKLLIDVTKINNILPFEYSISDIKYMGSTSNVLNFDITLNKKIDTEAFFKKVESSKDNILLSYNSLITEVTFIDIKIDETKSGYHLMLKYKTENIIVPKNDLSFVWTHYKSDDMFINPSKSNIIEIYVTAVKKDLKKNISVYSPLTSSEINKLILDINKRKMISDVVQVYNSSVYEITTAIKVYKDRNTNITDELLKSKIDNALDNFFDINNISLGTHFYMSRMIEWLHKNVAEIQHIEIIYDNNHQPITPSSTIEILGEKILFTQIVEKTKQINGVEIPQRQILIVS